MVTLSPKVNWRLSCMIFEGLRKSKLTGMKHAQKESAKKKPSSPISRNFFNYLQRFSTVLLYFIFLVSNISCYTLRQNRVFCHFNEKSIQNSRFFLMLIFFSDVNFFDIKSVFLNSKVNFTSVWHKMWAVITTLLLFRSKILYNYTKQFEESFCWKTSFHPHFRWLFPWIPTSLNNNY